MQLDDLKAELEKVGVKEMPEILCGAEGAVEVARHPDCTSVVTGKCNTNRFLLFCFTCISRRA